MKRAFLNGAIAFFAFLAVRPAAAADLGTMPVKSSACARIARLDRILSGQPFWICDRHIQLGRNPSRRRGAVERFD